MPTMTPFSWVVRFTVAPVWIQDGFTLSHERVHHMLAREIGEGTPGELQAEILAAPASGQLAKAQGYTPNTPRFSSMVKEIQEGVCGSGRVTSALDKAIRLLDSVAFVKEEGDSAKVLKQLREARKLMATRSGEPVEVES